MYTLIPPQQLISKSAQLQLLYVKTQMSCGVLNIEIEGHLIILYLVK